MEFVDTHCHLQFEQLAANLEQVLKNAQEADVTRLVCVGTNVSDSQKAIDIAAAHSNVWATIGVHPHEAKDFDFQGGSLELRRLLEQPRVVAVGEIGLDFYKNYSPKHEQEKLLRLQIELGIPTGWPFIFHVRDAWDEFWPIFDSYKGLRGVVHSFSAHPKQLEQTLSRGLHVGLNGIMTFSSDKLQLEAAKLVPKNRLVLETDAPFLAPKPLRGKTCEPKHIRDIAQFLAVLRGEDIKELADYTTKNAIELFSLQERTSQ